MSDRLLPGWQTYGLLDFGTMTSASDVRSTFVVAALEQVAALRQSAFHGDDGAVLRLLREFGEGEQLVGDLWVDLPEGYRREDVADLLALWSWRTSDNGAAIMRALERWVRECSDESKIWVAIHLEAYPFIDHADRIDYLTKVAEKFPSLSRRCGEMIAQSREWAARDAARVGRL